MKLYAKCRSCKADFSLSKNFRSRPDLIADFGEYFNLQCTECGGIAEYHANDIAARDSVGGAFVGTLIGTVIMVLTTMFVWNQGFITNIGLIIGGGIIAASNINTVTSNAKAFNKYKIRRNPKR